MIRTRYGERFHVMHVTIFMAHPHISPSMERVAHCLHRYLPVPSKIYYASPIPPAVLRSRLPSVVVHVLYVLHTRRHLQRLASRVRPSEIVHLVDHSESFLLPALTANLKVVSCHDLIPLVETRIYRHTLSRRLGQWLYRLTVRDIALANGVIACSHATARDTERLLGVPAEKIRVVYQGVDTDFFTPLPGGERLRRRETLGLHPQEIAILHVGSNAPYKNVPAILHVLSHLRQGGYAVRWIKAGEPLSTSLWRLAHRLGVADRIRVEPHVDDARLRELYQVCDLLLFPSLREGFGLPVLESLACGTPAVIADVPALSEWAGEVCASAPPHDTRGLAEKVLQSVENSRDCIARARLREFAEGYDWHRITPQIVDAYRAWER
ncbi:MAG: glycosyltransferase family 4 protein [Chthonomonadetes bacterium]|nr:glycosyltransferase family 4 protein [Chthonomonadetes bacterium]